MLGRHHLMISLATVSVAVLPFMDKLKGFTILIFLGTAIGSLIPDTDSADATIFHSKVKGLNGNLGGLVNNFFAPIFPLFGYTTKYLIYQPGIFFYNLVFSGYSFEKKHRSFTHSLLGVFTMTLVTGLYIAPLLIYFEVFSLPYLVAFLGAYMVGAFLHLLEDSCTKTGIAWNYPFSKTRLKGQIITSSKPEHTRKPRRFLYILGLLSIILTHISIAGFKDFSDLEIAAAALTSVSIAWIIFMNFSAGVKLEK